MQQRPCRLARLNLSDCEASDAAAVAMAMALAGTGSSGSNSNSSSSRQGAGAAPAAVAASGRGGGGGGAIAHLDLSSNHFTPAGEPLGLHQRPCTASLAHSLFHSFTRSTTHSLIRSTTQSLTRSTTHSLTRSTTLNLSPRLSPLLTHSLTHPLARFSPLRHRGPGCLPGPQHQPEAPRRFLQLGRAQGHPSGARAVPHGATRGGQEERAARLLRGEY